MPWNDLKASLPLDGKQEEVATAPADTPQLVLSPPGTGKTQMVVARLVHLICEQGIQPTEIAVLCFTRATVAEIVQRVTSLIETADQHDNLRFVTVRTFDSFATRLLLSANPDRELQDDGYEQRIKLAVEALEDPTSSETLMVKRVRHLIVDEIQDLVGIRAKLVQLMLMRIDGGFTLLGDPAQAIYGWSVAKDKDAITPAELLKWLREQTWASPLMEPKVEVNYRSEGESARIGRELRESLLSADDGDSEPLRRLKGVVAELESSGSAINPGGLLEARTVGSLCVLCRSNGEVMQVASLLTLKGVEAHTRPNPEDRGNPAWLARVLGTYVNPTIGRTQFLERWDELIAPEKAPEPLQVWGWLKYLEGEPGQGLSVRILHHKLLAGHRLPDAADAFVPSGLPPVSVSTIHASKGREFDHVVVLEPSTDIGEDAEASLEEARVLYVATTRARDTLRRIGRAGLPILWPVDVGNGRKRWVAKLAARKMYFMEVGLAGDFDPCSSVNTWDHPDDDAARQTQELIWNSIAPGSNVNVRQLRIGGKVFFKLELGASNGKEGPRIGQLSLGFRLDLKRALKAVSGSDWRLPFYMENIRVAAVVTEVLDTYPREVREPFLTSRFCLGIRLRGMGYLCKE